MKALTVKDFSLALGYALLTVGLTMVLHLAASVADKQMRVMQEMIWEKNRLHRGRKFAQMDYEYTDSREVNELNAEIDMKENTHGLGTVRIFFPAQ